jgi:hypothetical protein
VILRRFVVASISANTLHRESYESVVSLGGDFCGDFSFSTVVSIFCFFSGGGRGAALGSAWSSLDLGARDEPSFLVKKLEGWMCVCVTVPAD